MATVRCPSCFASLHSEAELPIGQRVKCPKCKLSFKVSAPAKPGQPPASDYWETARIDEAIDSAGDDAPTQSKPTRKPTPSVGTKPAKAPPSPPKSGPAPKTSEPVSSMSNPPSTDRRSLIIAAAAGGLSIGLAVALVVVLTRGRNNDGIAANSKGPPPTASDPKIPEELSVQGPNDGANKQDSAKSKPPAVGAAAGTDPQTSKPVPVESPASVFNDWPQDLEAGKSLARQQSRDLLLLFDSSDFSPFSKSLAGEVFSVSDWRTKLADAFVLVHLDFPEYPTARKRVVDGARNERLQARFFKNPKYPRIVLADADGRPYAIEEGYTTGQQRQFVETLLKARQTHSERDVLLAAVDAAEGPSRLAPARKALEFLETQVEWPTNRGDGSFVFDLFEFYAPQLAGWRQLADAQDRDNAQGQREWFFWQDWKRRVRRALANRTTPPATLQALAGEVDAVAASGCQWKKSSWAIPIHAKQAEIFEALKDNERRLKAIATALALEPSPDWRNHLNNQVQSSRPKTLVGSGTGFAVSAGGFIVTNWHVVHDAKTISVRLNGPGRKPLPAALAAKDPEHDLALLKVDLPIVTKLPALRVTNGASIGPGAEIATLGFPLGAAKSLFTRGVVSQRAENENHSAMVLNLTVNPGNSGGPLLDDCGNVVGIVAAKFTGEGPIDSYGIAIGASVVNRFLSANVKGHASGLRLNAKRKWPEIVEQIEPSIVQVIVELNGP